MLTYNVSIFLLFISDYNQVYKLISMDCKLYITIDDNIYTYCNYNYRMTSNNSKDLQTSQARSFAKWCSMLHPKIAFKAPCSYANCGTESVYDGILPTCSNQSWNTFLFEYLTAVRHVAEVQACRRAGNGRYSAHTRRFVCTCGFKAAPTLHAHPYVNVHDCVTDFCHPADLLDGWPGLGDSTGAVLSSGILIAEISGTSPRELFISVICKKTLFRIKVSPKNNLILKKEALVLSAKFHGILLYSLLFGWYRQAAFIHTPQFHGNYMS